MPGHILVVDTEAKIVHHEDGNQTQTFRLGCAIYLRWRSDRRKWEETEYMLRTLEDWFELLDSLTEPKRKLVIFAHNASYDFTILKMDTYLSSHDYVMDTHVIDTVFLVNAHKSVEGSLLSITFADTMNFYKMSLEKLGEIFSENKMEKPNFDTVSDYQLMTYCMQDTRVLATVIKEHMAFLKEHDLGNFRLTIAGQAFGAFRHRFMKEKILVHTCDDILEMEMDSYRGGRCECFSIGSFDEVYKLDINSMYPYIMRNKVFPKELMGSRQIDVESLHEIRNQIKSGLFILGDCEFELFTPAIACKREKLLFPIGEIRQTLTSPEIEYLLDNPDIGEIKHMRGIATYSQANLFREYVDYFYDIKTNSQNLAHSQMAKLFLNSLYGKLGQRSFAKYKEVTDPILSEIINQAMNEIGTNSIDWLDHESKRYMRFGTKLCEINESVDVLAYDSCPIIASTVTAYSRNYLFDLMRMAKLENVLYCDTDSLFVTKDGFTNLQPMISQTELGKLKLEEIGRCEIFGAKNYVFNDSIKLKGVKKDAVKLAENTYRQSQFVTKNMRYRNGTPDGIVEVKQIVKHISTIYNKGTVNSNGTVSPLVFKEFASIK